MEKLDLENLEPSGHRIPVLGDGYIQLIESWGSDARIVEAARMSTSKGFLGWGDYKCEGCGGEGSEALGATPENPGVCVWCSGELKFKTGDEKLLRTLFMSEPQHSTPFEMGGLVIEVQAPIFVFREWHRHRTQSYNEMSARYVPMPDVNYIPSLERLTNGGQSKTNKQGAGEAITEETANEWLGELTSLYAHAQRVYQSGLDKGIAKELARLPVPVARFSRMRASANLLNWLKFLTLRDHSKAQLEIQAYAGHIREFIEGEFPRTAALFKERRDRK